MLSRRSPPPSPPQPASAASSSRAPRPSPQPLWKLHFLGEAPAFTREDDSTTVRPLFFAGEPYRGKPTRVFASHASPATLEKRAPTFGERFPAVVLVHGGGGAAFREWAKVWVKRGYAAIAMDAARDLPHAGENADAKKTGLAWREAVRI